MERLTSIVSVNREGVIGRGDALPWRLRSDMRFFREQTLDKVVLMGRRTFDSPGRGCLPRRYNIVVSRRSGLLAETGDGEAVGGIEAGLWRASLAPREYDGCFVIGGASIYEQYAPYVDRYLVTLVDMEVPDGDTFFNQAPLGDPGGWEISPLFSRAAGPEDDAAFCVFEVLSRQPEHFRERRLHAIHLARTAAMPDPVPVRTRRAEPVPVQPVLTMS